MQSAMQRVSSIKYIFYHLHSPSRESSPGHRLRMVNTLQSGKEGGGNKGGIGKSLKVNKRGVAISGGLEKLHIFSCVLWQFVPFASYITERMMWKLALSCKHILKTTSRGKNV